MERIVYRITLDSHKTGIQRTLQGFETADNMARTIAVNITASGDTYEIPLDNVVAMMYVTTPNASEPSINECRIEDNTIYYDVLPIVEEGITEMKIKLIETSVDGAKRVLLAPKFVVEVTESGTEDDSAEQTTTFTALENAIAKAHGVYDQRLLNIEIGPDCVFRAIYADGTVYENHYLHEALYNGNALLSESWAKGGTGIREDEETNNSKYFSNVSKSSSIEASASADMVRGLVDMAKLHSTYTSFDTNFKTGELEYISASHNFDVNEETGELEVEGEFFDPTDVLEKVADDYLDEKTQEISKNTEDIDSVEKEVTQLKSDIDKLNEGGLNLKDEVIAEDINNWLNDHPEATTTVQDHSLTIDKMVIGTLGYVTPEMFGAKGDGITDDTTSIKDVIEYCKVNNKNLILSDRVYCVSSSIIIDFYFNIIGYGATIKATNDMPDGVLQYIILPTYDGDAEFVNRSDLHNRFFVKGLTIDCNHISSCGLKTGGIFMHFDDIRVLNCIGKSIWSRGISYYSKIYIKSDPLIGTYGMYIDGNDNELDNIVVVNAETAYKTQWFARFSKLNAFLNNKEILKTSVFFEFPDKEYSGQGKRPVIHECYSDSYRTMFMVHSYDEGCVVIGGKYGMNEHELIDSENENIETYIINSDEPVDETWFGRFKFIGCDFEGVNTNYTKFTPVVRSRLHFDSSNLAVKLSNLLQTTSFTIPDITGITFATRNIQIDGNVTDITVDCIVYPNELDESKISSDGMLHLFNFDTSVMMCGKGNVIFPVMFYAPGKIQCNPIGWASGVFTPRNRLSIYIPDSIKSNTAFGIAFHVTLQNKSLEYASIVPLIGEHNS